MDHKKFSLYALLILLVVTASLFITAFTRGNLWREFAVSEFILVVTFFFVITLLKPNKL